MPDVLSQVAKLEVLHRDIDEILVCEPAEELYE